MKLKTGTKFSFNGDTLLGDLYVDGKLLFFLDIPQRIVLSPFKRIKPEIVVRAPSGLCRADDNFYSLYGITIIEASDGFIDFIEVLHPQYKWILP